MQVKQQTCGGGLLVAVHLFLQLSCKNEATPAPPLSPSVLTYALIVQQAETIDSRVTLC